MVDRWIVFGGWATDPAILAPIFGTDPVLIDAGESMSSIMQDSVIKRDWINDLSHWIKPRLPAEPFGIAGWSTGALIAYAAASQLHPAIAVLLSATPSFCRRPGFTFGWKSSILHSMRDKLALDPTTDLGDFYAQCGLDQDTFHLQQSCRSLADGLQFLEHASLLPVVPLPCPTLFLHGREDAVVPIKAGELFCKQASGTFAAFDGPHAFFIGREGEVAGAVRRFVKS